MSTRSSKSFGTILLILIGALVSIPLLIAVAAAANGYVLSILWGWFIVTTFHAPALSIPAAIGISMVVSYLTATYNDAKDPDRKWFGPLVYVISRPLFALGIGAVVHSFL